MILSFECKTSIFFTISNPKLFLLPHPVSYNNCCCSIGAEKAKRNIKPRSCVWFGVPDLMVVNTDFGLFNAVKAKGTSFTGKSAL